MPTISDGELHFGREFEKGGIDVSLWCSVVTTRKFSFLANNITYAYHAGDHYQVTAVSTTNIEIKPTVGDDYPTVLRQMRANGSRILFVQDYTGKGASEQQFIKTFELPDIKVVFRRQVDAVQVTHALTGTIRLP